MEISIMGQKVTITNTRTRVRKNGSANGGGYRQCNMCRGSGVVYISKHGSRKKK